MRYRGKKSVVLMIIVVNIFVGMINIIAGGGSIWGLALSGGGYVKDFGAASYLSIFVQREWWRLLTCGYIHMGVFHLMFNSYALMIVGNEIENQLGHMRTWISYHLGIILTSAAWCLLIKQRAIVGASLGIYIWLGMMFRWCKYYGLKGGFQIAVGKRRYLICYIVIGCLFGIDTIAVHVIGIVIGMLLGGIFKDKMVRNLIKKE